MKLSLIMALAIALGNAFEYRSPFDAEIFPYTKAVNDYSSEGIISNPSLLPFSSGFAISGSASRPYSEDELMAGSSVIQYSGYSAGLQMSWSHFGTDMYRENIYSISCAYSPVSAISIGLSSSVYNLSIKTEKFTENRNFYDYGASATIRPFSFMDISFMQNNINSLLKKSHQETIYPERSAGILIRPDRGLSFAWNITDTSFKKINTFSAMVNPLPILSLSGGYSRETSSCGASAAIFLSDFKISYSLLYHSYLGYTHTAAVTFLTDSKTESVSYRKKSGPHVKEISVVNINSATYDDIVNLPGMNEIHAARIIAYRDEIGPVSADALTRIGMSNEEIKLLDDYIYGLERDGVSLRKEQKLQSFTPFKNRESRQDKTKKLFRELLAKGIPAGRGIEYSRLAASGEKNKFLRILNEDKKLTDQQKGEVRRICGI